jgi:plastocyanin
MKQRREKIWCCLRIALCVGCIIGTAATVQAAGAKTKSIHKLVYINAEQGLDPRSVTVAPGTTVIWINNSDYRLQLKFIDQQVSMACAAPVNFSLDEKEKVFISTGIPLGGVASLCFIQKGAFQYKLIKMDQFGAPGTSERFSGVITVR